MDIFTCDANEVAEDEALIAAALASATTTTTETGTRTTPLVKMTDFNVDVVDDDDAKVVTDSDVNVVTPSSAEVTMAKVGRHQRRYNYNNEEQDQPLWTKQYEYLRILFQHFPMGDLTSAAQVCSTWSQVGRTTRARRRNTPFVIFHSQYLVQVKCQPSRPLLDPFHPSQDGVIFQHNRYYTYNDAIVKGFRRNFSEPHFLILIGTTGWKDYEIDPKNLEDLTESQSAALLRQTMFSKIPPNVGAMGMLTSGIASILPDGLGTIEFEKRDNVTMTCLAIPKVPGLKVKTFTMTKEMKRKYGQSDLKLSEYCRQNCNEILNISPEDNVKGLLWFHSDANSRNTLVLTSVHEYLRQNPKTGFGGGIVNTTVRDTVTDGKLKGCGLLICCEDENILDLRVGSAAIYDVGMTETNKQNLLKFKNHGMDAEGRDSCALMFACNGRGYKMHGRTEKNVESQLFRNYYPNTPLIGAFTMGEYVHEFIPGQRKTPEVTPDVSSLIYSFTTVFVFLSWKSTPQGSAPAPSTSKSAKTKAGL